MNNKAPWVLIDYSWLVHRAMYSTGGLEFEDIPTGVIYGVLDAIRTVCKDKRILSNKVAIMLDSRESFRKEIYPKYKCNRSKLSETQKEERAIMYKQSKLLSEKILPDSGFRVYEQEGLESDDLIAMAARQVRQYAENDSSSVQAIMITADGDLFQSITQTVHWYNPSKNLYYTPSKFYHDKGISPEKWDSVKCIAGCSTDNVGGVSGVGECTAIKYLKGTLPKGYKTYRCIVSERGQEIINRNQVLVKLPCPDTRMLDLEEPEYNPQVFFGYCKLFGISTYLEGSKRRELEDFFKGKFVTEHIRRRKGR